MILSGLEIKKRLNSDIFITPYSEDQLNTNSYNLRLHDEILIYDDDVLDMKKENTATASRIPEEGLLLETGQLYLGRTIEHTRTENLVPMLEGRSSIGRLGLFIHVTAGFGDVGFNGYWTLEMFCVKPIRIYAGIEIAQIFYHSIEGRMRITQAPSIKIIQVFSQVCCIKISNEQKHTLRWNNDGSHRRRTISYSGLS